MDEGNTNSEKFGGAIAACIEKQLQSEQKKTVAFLFEHPFAIYDALPVVNLIRDRCTITVMCPAEYVFCAAAYLSISNHQFEPIEQYDRTDSKRFTIFFESLFVSPKFSEDYMARKARRVSSFQLSLKLRIAPLLSRGISNPNLLYPKICRRLGFDAGQKSRLQQAAVVVSFTKVYRPYLLANVFGYHINVMESWDHPEKEPYLIWPDKHFTWNKSLAEATVRHQKISNIAITAPLKFRYTQDLSLVAKRDIAVYPMCTSSTYQGFEGELKLIGILASKVSKLGLTLVVRPYPLAPATDADALARIPFVSVQDYNTTPGQLEQLDSEYYREKLSLIKSATVVINTGTTFAFDAAIADAPVIQLEVSPLDFGDFGAYLDAAHIRNYLYGEHSMKVDELLNISNLAEILQSASLCSSLLKSWIYPSAVRTANAL